MNATPPSVLVLGGAGMIGLGVLRHLTRLGLAATGTSRNPNAAPDELRALLTPFTLGSDSVSTLLDAYSPGDVVVNTLGLIKHHIDESSATDRRAAIAVNAEFPYELAEAAAQRGLRVVQVVTDCVFSGSTGGYSESSHHDAYDVYGHSKSLGEVPSGSVLNLRCSVIGPELRTRVNLLEWVLSHEAGSSFSGFTDHRWNGITTYAFARIVGGILQSGDWTPGTAHVVPQDETDKDALSRMILAEFGRADVTVLPVATGTPVDRTLTTVDPSRNARLWRNAGYEVIPTIAEMVRELAATVSNSEEAAG